jgi:hypothetical protein
MLCRNEGEITTGDVTLIKNGKAMVGGKADVATFRGNGGGVGSVSVTIMAGYPVLC